MKQRPRIYYTETDKALMWDRWQKGEYPAGSWIRNPHKSKHAPYTDDEGALIYVKVGHLA